MADPSRGENQLQIRLFGPVDVAIEGQTMPKLRSRAGYWLLALLTLRANREVSRLWLAGCLWPDSDDATGRNNLRRSLTDLRAALGPAAERIESPTANTLLLRIASHEADVLAFDRAIREDTIDALQRAVTLYRAPLLEGCDEIWAAPEQQPRREAYLQALARLGEKQLMAGAASEALPYLRMALAADPTRESLCGQLMAALASNGDRAAATETYRSLRLILRHEMNVDPSPELTALYRRILHEAPKPPDLPTPTTPPSPALQAPSPINRLPNTLTSLVGREAEIAEISGCLETTPLLTLTGPGGIGKTRLAIQVAQELSECYDDGVWFVELAALTDPALLPKAVASALGVPEENECPLLDAVRNHLRSRELLLILDNCEHLIDACAHLVGALMRSCPKLQLLTTSRQPLGITGEIVWRVPALALPPHKTAQTLTQADIPDVVSKYAALHLFGTRAKAVQPAFRWNTPVVRAAIDICTQLDGIPLAIELAAARVRSLSVEQIAERLKDRFRLLTGGSRSALPRQQTLRAAIDWGYDLLDPQERILLRRLSVFSGDCSLEGVEGICTLAEAEQISPDFAPLDAWEVLDVLDHLVEKSFVMTDVMADGEVRYRLLDTIRHYARMRLEETEEFTPLLRRYRDWYLRLVQEAQTKLQGAPEVVWIHRFEREHDNLRGVLDWCMQHPEEADNRQIELQMVACLWRFWMIRGHLREGLNRLQHALEASRDLEQTPELKIVRFKALYGAGGLAWQMSEIELARELMQECLPLVEESGDTKGYGDILNGLGCLLYSQDKVEEARPYWEEALAIRREAGERESLPGPLNNLGYVAYRLEDLESARAYHTEALQIATEGNNLLSASASLTGLGNIARIEKDYRNARNCYEMSLEQNRRLGDKEAIAGCLANLAAVYLWEREYAAAIEALLESLTLNAEIDNRRGMAEELLTLAEVAACTGKQEFAARLFGASELLLASFGMTLDADTSQAVSAAKRSLESALGAALYKTYYDEGQAMDLDRALAYIRQEFR